MTSLKQIEANRRNAQKSTGPITLAGKQHSRRNALRHGLTAETVIGVLESVEDYTAFEASLMVEFNPRTVIDSELVARLASLLWRLRRATAIETGLFEMQADPLAAFRHSLESPSRSTSNFPQEAAPTATEHATAESSLDDVAATSATFTRRGAPDLTQCFFRLANQTTFLFDRLSRYEANLWRQAIQITIALNRSPFLRK